MVWLGLLISPGYICSTQFYFIVSDTYQQLSVSDTSMEDLFERSSDEYVRDDDMYQMSHLSTTKMKLMGLLKIK